MKKRFFTALVFLCLVIGLLPAMAMAADGHYLTFSSDAPFTLQTKNAQKNWNGTLYYSTDASTWTEWNGTQITAAAGKLYLRGTGNKRINIDNHTRFVLDGSAGIACTGNIETLLDYQEVADGKHPAMEKGCFACLFYHCTNLTTAPELPATTLSESCYSRMFYGCENLTAAPELPATTLAESCYSSMFSGCENLTAAPKLPATTLASSCYTYMFAYCYNLMDAPELPATTLADNCYAHMFSYCTSLTTAPELPATTLAPNCYFNMFSICASLVTAPEILPAMTLTADCYNSMFYACNNLTAAPKLPATTLADRCYSSMFRGCNSLTAAPELPATTLAFRCYLNMFMSCTSLTAAPQLPATTLAEKCYVNMFRDCTNLKLKLSVTPENGYIKSWSIPVQATAVTDWNTDMFYGSGVTFTGDPAIGTIYYLPDQYAITLNANHKDNCAHASTVTATYDTAVLAYSDAQYPPVYADGYEHITYALQGWFTAKVGGEKIIDADGSLLPSTSCTDENGVWKSLAPPTLYAQWKQIIYPATDPTGGSTPQTATQSEELTFRVDADAAKLITVQVDGKDLVPGRDFTITDNPLP